MTAHQPGDRPAPGWQDGVAGRHDRISVVIPAKNEALNLRWVFGRMPDVHEVIVVDGHSTDGTLDVAREFWPDAKLLTQDRIGKGNALACGFAASTGDIIVTLDADGSADPREIPSFVAALRAGADFVKGTRFALGGGSADISNFRKLGNAGLTQCVNLLFKTRYTDLCYGYNAFWAYCLPHIRADCTGFEIETLMSIRVARARLRVEEVGSFEKLRMHGSSNLHAARDGMRILRTILREWADDRRVMGESSGRRGQGEHPGQVAGVRGGATGQVALQPGGSDTNGNGQRRDGAVPARHRVTGP
jgi:glycosyltransferase involved in cell wall biosynthesis